MPDEDDEAQVGPMCRPKVTWPHCLRPRLSNIHQLLWTGEVSQKNQFDLVSWWTGILCLCNHQSVINVINGDNRARFYFHRDNQSLHEVGVPSRVWKSRSLPRPQIDRRKAVCATVRLSGWNVRWSSAAFVLLLLRYFCSTFMISFALLCYFSQIKTYNFTRNFMFVTRHQIKCVCCGLFQHKRTACWQTWKMCKNILHRFV